MASYLLPDAAIPRADMSLPDDQCDTVVGEVGLVLSLRNQFRDDRTTVLTALRARNRSSLNASDYTISAGRDARIGTLSFPVRGE